MLAHSINRLRIAQSIQSNYRRSAGRNVSETFCARNASSAAVVEKSPDSGKHHDGDHGHSHDNDEPPHARLPDNFLWYAAAVWGTVGLFIAQDRYFTRADENGRRRLHPITRWILYHRQSEHEREEEILDLMKSARQRAELNVFYQMENHRAVKSPTLDGRMLRQSEWGVLPTASDTEHVKGLSEVQWRKGYGEDEDSVSVLQKKGLADSKPPSG